MGRLVIQISDELEREFRSLVAEIFGLKKGALSMAAEQAIRMWIDKMRAKRLARLSFRSFEVTPRREVRGDLAQRLLRELREDEESRLEEKVQASCRRV